MSQPHSVALWLHCEIHPRRTDGALSGTPVSQKNYRGVIHGDDLEEATSKLEEFILQLQNSLKQLQEDKI